jgi:hypothetical protein
VPIIPALRLRWEYYKFKANQGYTDPVSKRYLNKIKINTFSGSTLEIPVTCFWSRIQEPAVLESSPYPFP